MSVDTIMLVHGAWHGGWCWDRVKPLLEQQGFKVLTPTLPGLEQGEQPATAPSLDDHVNAVVDALTAASSPVLLVGHSYGGMVVTAAADRARDKVAGLVYLDAAVPKNGQSFASHIPGIDAESVARREGAFKAMAGGGEWLAPPPFEMIGISEDADKEWLQPLLKPHPLRTWLDNVSLSDQGTGGIPKTYVVVTSPPTTMMGYPLHAEAAKAGGEWTHREIACGHEMMVVEPQQTADYILEAARAA